MNKTLLGHDKIPFPDHKSFHPFRTPITWGRNSDNPGRNRAACCGNPSPIGRSKTGWGSYTEPADLGEGRFLSPNQKSFQKATTRTNRGAELEFPRVDTTAPYSVETATQGTLLLLVGVRENS